MGTRLSRTMAIGPLLAVCCTVIGAQPQDPKLLEKARALQKRIVVFDSHVDLPFDYGSPGLEAGTDGKTQFDLPKVERGGVKGAALAIFVPQGPRTPEGIEDARKQAEKKLGIITGIAVKYPDRAALAYTPDDVRRIAASGKFAIVESILNGYPIGADISQLDAWYNKGVRIFGFVHQGNNDLADSSRPNVLGRDKIDENGGLTDAGKTAVARLNELGVLIDVSQLSAKAFWDVMRLTKAPVAATHSCVRALADHPRNLGDDQLEALRKNGGVIQIAAYSSWVRTLSKDWQDKANAVRKEYGLPTETPIQSFMPTTTPTGPPLSPEKYEEYSKKIHQVLLADAPRATVAELVNAVDYAVKKIGVDHVGISSDFNHGGGVIGWDNEGEAVNVTAELLKRGYSEQEIGKLWGGNFLRVWAEAQKLAQSSTAAQSLPAPPPGGVLQGQAIYKLEDALLEWPLPAAERAYGAIDGKHLHEYVEDLAAISRRYRDSGHPQFWGRIIGTSADAETAQWMVDKFHKLGLSDIHIQPFDLAPQWMPQSWNVTASGSGETLHLESAQPAYQTPATPAGGLDLEGAYVGTGSEADYIGKDVRGKAVFVFSMPLPGSWRHTATAEDALRRAEAKGAAAIFAVIALPGNIRTQLYPTRTNVPTFSMGMQDGYAMRDLIGKGGAGNPPHVKVRLDVEMTPNLKSGTVWGTLPGATAETIYIIAHRDGWFESGTDSGSGVATMTGLAEYFASIPKEKRRRTIIFLGSTGHHNGANMSGAWLLGHRDEAFEKTALLINCEHTATMQTYLLGEDIRQANTYTGMLWYAGGPRREKLQDIAVKAFREFGVVTYATPERAAPGGEMSGLWPYVPGVQASDYNVFFHSDHEGPDTVPWTGLEAITRAYAKIIDGVNTLELSDLVRPPEPPNGVIAPLAPKASSSR